VIAPWSAAPQLGAILTSPVATSPTATSLTATSNTAKSTIATSSPATADSSGPASSVVVTRTNDFYRPGKWCSPEGSKGAYTYKGKSVPTVVTCSKTRANGVSYDDGRAHWVVMG
jgi:hypothetical protein